MMKWKVYFIEDNGLSSHFDTTYIGAKTANEAIEEGATKLGIVDLDRFYAHAIPTGEPWEED